MSGAVTFYDVRLEAQSSSWTRSCRSTLDHPKYVQANGLTNSLGKVGPAEGIACRWCSQEYYATPLGSTLDHPKYFSSMAWSVQPSKVSFSDCPSSYPTYLSLCEDRRLNCQPLQRPLPNGFLCMLPWRLWDWPATHGHQRYFGSSKVLPFHGSIVWFS